MNEALSEKEFNDFIRTLANAEVISDLGIKMQTGCKIADYFFDNRSVIGELKCLEVDTGKKLQELIDELMDEGKIIVYGKPPFNKIIDGLSLELRDSLKQEAFDRVSTSLEGAYEDANRQIRDTKDNLKLPNSSGFLILLNNGNLTLDPKTAVYKLNQLMNKKKDDKVRFESLHFGLYISTKHYNINGKEKIYPLITFINNHLRNLNEEENAFVKQFQESYAKLKNIPIYFPDNLKINDAIEFPFKVD